MAFGQFLSFFSQQIVFIWLLIFITPLYVFIASVLAKGIQILYQMSLNRQSIIYRYLGDISWLFPFKQNEQEFKLVHIMLMAVLMAGVSLIIIGGVMLQTKFEKVKKREGSESRNNRKINNQQ